MSSSDSMFASEDLRLSAKQMCWPAQHASETALTDDVQQFGQSVGRAYPVNPEKGARFY